MAKPTRGEGLVVKKLDCIYSTNSRGADWIKVKPESVPSIPRMRYEVEKELLIG